jgi:poly(3-hydroxybutyrate) depolymerase
MFPRIAAILGVFIAQPFAAMAAGSPADAIQPNSVWQDGRSTTLTILERNGNTFRARVETRNAVREVTGTVKDKTISWLAKDVRAISGGPGGDNFGTITDGKIDFTWHDAKGGSGKFSLWRGFEDRTFHGPGGKTLPYKLHVPGGYDKAKRYPVVLIFDGLPAKWTWPTNGRFVWRFVTSDAQAKHPCFVVALCPQDEWWMSIPDEAFHKPMPLSRTPSENIRLALGALDEVMKSYSVDADRVYLIGCSNAAYAVWDLLARYPKRWAAAIPVSGGGDPARIVAAKNVPIWATHGDNDKVVPVERSRELIAALKAAGGHPKYSEYRRLGHGDGISSACNEPDLVSWLLDQKRSTR